MNIQERNSEVEGWVPTRTEVDEWLREQPLCILSTLDEDGWPMGATVAFSVTHAGELLVGTADDSSKAQNIKTDERVAVTVTDAERRITVQMQGTARLLAQKAFLVQFADEHYRQRPQSLPFRDEPGQSHILITPQYLKFSDCQPHPWVVTEYTENSIHEADN